MKRMISNMSKCVQCKHRVLGYYLTQVLTGHGCIKVYMHKIDRLEYCGEVDTVEDTVFEFIRLVVIKETAWMDLEKRLKPKNMVDRMIEDRKK